MNSADNNIVISSRVRLARNLVDFPYPSKLNDERAFAVARYVYDAVSRSDNFSLYKMNKISELDANVLMEKHLISVDLLKNSPYGSVIINDCESISIMVNEEDHIRLQGIVPGFDIRRAYDLIDKADNMISANVNYAFDSKFGYLTSCPTNLGTGMRASALMFLPGLTMTKGLESCINAVSRLNMAVRGVYGEGSSADGFLYQISNEHTLGLKEESIIENVSQTVRHIIETEERARQYLVRDNATAIKNQIMRAWGVLTNSYSMMSKEFMELMALVKLGVDLKIINVTDRARIDKLIIEGQPANLLAISSKKLTAEERDIYRSQYVGKVLESIKVK